ncbi:TPA: 30S ribosomal protein S5 [Candidatus Micrarchaeota archaeon]|jgi:small subunit ribosomal protein S5|nr:30S ribosomal protein S5 [Candidatus Micrarchaeota archaeon]
MFLNNRRYERRERERTIFNIEAWTPKTELGRDVKEKRVTSIEQVFHDGRKIEEPEIIEALLPDLNSEIIEIANVQRMTKNNRKMKYRATAVVGDGKGHVGVGSGKDVEVKAAIESAILDAKSNVIPIIMGCGSWQCLCGTKHSLPIKVTGRCGSVEVILKPAPRGLGIVANPPVKKMLELAGVKDAWEFSRGRTRAKYNTVLAVYRALGSINEMKNITEKMQ